MNHISKNNSNQSDACNQSKVVKYWGNLYKWPKLKGPNEIWPSPRFSMKYGLLLASTSCEFAELPPKLLSRGTHTTFALVSRPPLSSFFFFSSIRFSMFFYAFLLFFFLNGFKLSRRSSLWLFQTSTRPTSVTESEREIRVIVSEKRK